MQREPQGGKGRYPLPEYPAAIYEGTAETSDFEVRDDLLLLKRRFSVERPASQVDVFGPLWSLSYANLKPSLIGVEGAPGVNLPYGHICFVIPPFEVVKWLLSPGTIEFVGTFSSTHWPSDLPQSSYFFGIDRPPPITSSKQILEFLRQSEGAKRMVEFHPSVLALAAKKLIDRKYKDSLSLSDISLQLGVSSSALTKSFQRAFHISPLSYRNRVRIGLAKYFMLLHRYSVTRAAMEVGFENLSDFNRAFKKISNETPTEFRSCHLNLRRNAT